MVSRYALFIAFLVGTKKASLASNSTGARQLRGLSYMVPEIPVRNADDGPFLYRITIVSTFFEGEDGSILATEREKLISCIPIFGGQETDGLYAIKLPQTFLDDDKHANDIAAGKLFVSITNTELHNEEVMLAGDSVISVISDPRNMERAESASTMGTKTLAIVRISTKNAAPNDDADTLREGLFSPYKINLKTQFSACSFGKLEWVLAPHGERGVLEVFVDQPVSDFTSGSALVTAAQDTMKAKMGIDNAASLGDKVIMCLPPGTGGWVASSGVNHWRAQFNNEWCLSLTATMHET